VSAPKKTVVPAPWMTKVISGTPWRAGAAVIRSPPAVTFFHGSASASA
jgi:hypothetical protein